MEHKGTVVLETDRLILRKFREDDAQSMFDNWASNPNVTKYITWAPHENVEITKAIISEWVKSYRDSDFYQWALELKEIGLSVPQVTTVFDILRKKI